MNATSNRAGILVMIATTFVFAAQDGISRHLAAEYNTFMVVMIRYWFFAFFAIWLAMRQSGGLASVRTTQPVLQISRSLLLAAEICVAVYGFTLLGLVESHAIFACYPLLVTALAGPMLGEKAGWRRWLAILVGFLGMVIILQPGRAVFQPMALIPFLSALMFALYSILTRFAARKDSTTTSFFWTGIVGAVAMTLVGLPQWERMTVPDAGWMAALCITGVFGHWLLIKCYELAEASAVQPFAFFQLIFAGLIGMAVFGEALELHVALGAVLIVAAGLFALWRAHILARRRNV